MLVHVALIKPRVGAESRVSSDGLVGLIYRLDLSPRGKSPVNRARTILPSTPQEARFWLDRSALPTPSAAWPVGASLAPRRPASNVVSSGRGAESMAASAETGSHY